MQENQLITLCCCGCYLQELNEIIWKETNVKLCIAENTKDTIFASYNIRIFPVKYLYEESFHSQACSIIQMVIIEVGRSRSTSLVKEAAVETRLKAAHEAKFRPRKSLYPEIIYDTVKSWIARKECFILYPLMLNLNITPQCPYYEMAMLLGLSTSGCCTAHLDIKLPVW